MSVQPNFANCGSGYTGQTADGTGHLVPTAGGGYVPVYALPGPGMYQLPSVPLDTNPTLTAALNRLAAALEKFNERK